MNPAFFSDNTALLALLERWAEHGWLRALDSVRGQVNLQPGLLSKQGWFFIDDSQAALVGDDAVTRRGLDLQYRDGYIFAYGRDYKQALADFRALSGAAPMPASW